MAMTASLASWTLPAPFAWRRWRYRLASALCRTPFHRFTLPRRASGTVGVTGGDLWPGNAVMGSTLAQGMFGFAGQAIYNPTPFWTPVGALDPWIDEMNGFGWLRDLKAMGDAAGRETAQALIAQWITENERWSGLTWRPDVLGTRLANWLALHDFYASGAPAGFADALALSVTRQAGHLMHVLPGPLSGSALIGALKGLVYAGLALPGHDAWLARGLDMLERELATQLLADGGHIERSPATHLRVLRHLVDVRTALGAGGRPAPASLTRAIEGLTPIVRMLRHGDGGLALFNDSDEDEAWHIDAVLVRADAKSKTATEAPATGFQRLAAQRTVVLVECGAMPPQGFDAHAHAGALSFEMSVGRERFIVNCGAHPSDPNWRRVQRSTAAHSTLIIDDTNSAQAAAEGHNKRTAEQVRCARHEAEGAVWLDLAHDGYKKAFELEHRRRLHLSASGDELRGEDKVVGANPRRFVVRFHIHPDVQVQIAQNRQGALFRMGSGTGYRMRAIGGEVSLDDSVYLGRAGHIRKTHQVVISVDQPQGEDTVKWVFARETR